MVRAAQSGLEAFRLLWGNSLEESAFDRLLKRHKTVAHTTVNLLAYNLLQRLGFQAIEL
jgi:hypothetical protein